MPPATAGWEQQAGEPQPQIPFSELSPDSFLFSLPTFDEKTNKLHLHAEKLSKTVLPLNLGHFVGFFFFLFCAALFYFMLPLWRDNYRATSEAASPGLEAEGRTPKLLRLKLHCIWTWGVFFSSIFYFILLYIYILFAFIYLFFIFILIFILFIFYFQSSVSLMPFQLTVN
jgi:hypothetical protein